MNYREALAWLFGTQLFGIKLGLESMQRLLRQLNLPAAGQPIIHVAGTNGKGSVCAMIDSIARAAGYRSGLFTSPHLVTFRERIRVNGEMISQHEVALGLTTLRECMQGWEPHPTFFEITTALALWHFERCNCELVVLETGMGGRLDATNAITPVVSVITPIDLDHQKWLGDTIEQIAAEKAGIIKPSVPVISSPQRDEAARVLIERARACEAPLEFVRERDAAHVVALPGAHQRENAVVAQRALAATQLTIDEHSIAAGLANVSWPARFQRIGEHLVIDGAHNPAGARVLTQTWRDTFGPAKARVVFAVLRDKDAAAMARELASIANHFVVAPAQGERAVPPEELAQIVRAAVPEIGVSIAPSLASALNPASELTLVTGSLHFAGEALAFLQGDPDAFEDCAQ